MNQKEDTPPHLKDVVEKVLFDLKKSEKSPKNRVGDVWNHLVGAKISKHSKAYALRNKTLFVRVDDSSWAFELSTRYKAGLLKRLQHTLGENTVSNIYFSVGDL